MFFILYEQNGNSFNEKKIISNCLIPYAGPERKRFPKQFPSPKKTHKAHKHRASERGINIPSLHALFPA